MPTLIKAQIDASVSVLHRHGYSGPKLIDLIREIYEAIESNAPDQTLPTPPVTPGNELPTPPAGVDNTLPTPPAGVDNTLPTPPAGVDNELPEEECCPDNELPETPEPK